VSVTIGDDGHFLYRHQASEPRIPASNEKLLLSMALFDRLGPSLQVPTLVSAEAEPDADGVIDGNLWILGRGDPRSTAPRSPIWPAACGRPASRRSSGA
jgi:D-alanyl-D-alanine carboxypeptidase